MNLYESRTTRLLGAKKLPDHSYYMIPCVFCSVFGIYSYYYTTLIVYFDIFMCNLIIRIGFQSVHFYYK